jgi:hypothetical protein
VRCFNVVKVKGSTKRPDRDKCTRDVVRERKRIMTEAAVALIPAVEGEVVTTEDMRKSLSRWEKQANAGFVSGAKALYKVRESLYHIQSEALWKVAPDPENEGKPYKSFKAYCTSRGWDLSMARASQLVTEHAQYLLDEGTDEEATEAEAFLATRQKGGSGAGRTAKKDATRILRLHEKLVEDLMECRDVRYAETSPDYNADMLKAVNAFLNAILDVDTEALDFIKDPPAEPTETADDAADESEEDEDEDEDEDGNESA